MSLREAIRELVKEEDVLGVGIITKVDETHLTVSIQPEKGDVEIKNVPIRVWNTDDDEGVYIVPKTGTWCLYALVDGRATLLQVQEWERVIIKRGSLTVSIDSTGKVEADNGSGKVLLNNDGSVKIESSSVEIGQGVMGGVITDKTLPACLFTGASMTAFSSKTVKASS